MQDSVINLSKQTQDTFEEILDTMTSDIVNNSEGMPEIADEIKGILAKTNHNFVTPDYRISITVKGGFVDDVKVNMQHKRARE